MFYKRPSLRRGGMPTGIDTLSPRVEAQSGFFGQRPLFFGDYRQIGLDFPSTMSGMQIPTGNQVMMKSFPQDASAMGVASVAKKPLSSTQKLDQEMNEMIEMGGYGEIEKGPETDLTKLPNFLLKAIGTEETREILKDREEGKTTDKSEKSDDGFLPNAGPEKGVNFDEIVEEVVTTKKDTDDKPKELTFDDIYQKEYNRLERLVGGREDEKGMLAIALSDAIGTEGTIADKAAALNKSLLKIVGERKANKRDIAKLAYGATKEIEKAKIAAGKVSDSQKNLNRAEKLIGIINNKNSSKADIASAKKELKNLRDAVSVFSKKDSGLSSTDKTLAESFNKLALKLSSIEDKNSDVYKKTYKRYLQARELAARVPELSQSIILNDALAGLTVKKDGGRIGYAMGTPEPTAKDMSNVPAEPVEQNLSFQELRSRLPKEITDDIVRLISDSSQALQDFAYIRTQGDVNKFNMKYGVNLVLPAQA